MIDSWYRNRVRENNNSRKPAGIRKPFFRISPSHTGDGHEDPEIPRPKPPDFNQFLPAIRSHS
ncbi:MAG: hypothetical protein NTW79_00395 [Candidatus Berkelbacteria bacterium]|nr:hypothetical protein [Candidatus Berkelbacteria bacterium]